MKAALLLLLVPGLVLAQGIKPLSPYRADTATSYRATGPNGIKTTPQASPAALGACAALSGAYASATPPLETGTRPYYCEGADWHRVHTEADGPVLNGDTFAALRGLVLAAPDGSTALSLLGGKLDLGPWPDDEISVDDAGRVVIEYPKFGQALISRIDNRDANLLIAITRWMRFAPNAQSPIAECSLGDAGACAYIQALAVVGAFVCGFAMEPLRSQ